MIGYRTSYHVIIDYWVNMDEWYSGTKGFEIESFKNSNH